MGGPGPGWRGRLSREERLVPIDPEHPAGSPATGSRKALFENFLRRAEAADVTMLEITCMLRTSLPFWKTEGFVPLEPVPAWSEIPVRRILDSLFDLPPGSASAVVTIAYYPEAQAVGVRRARGGAFIIDRIDTRAVAAPEA